MKKGKKQKAEKKPEGSEIIRQCVIYVQSMAALKAGFAVDTGNFAYAGCGPGELGSKQIRIADKALRQLIALSPAFVEGHPPLTREELLAKAGVLAALWEQEGGITRSCEANETAYVRFFAREVEDCMRVQAATERAVTS
jgi:hypothetical protein